MGADVRERLVEAKAAVEFGVDIGSSTGCPLVAPQVESASSASGCFAAIAVGDPAVLVGHRPKSVIHLERLAFDCTQQQASCCRLLPVAARLKLTLFGPSSRAVRVG
jgi:hypothetical protein